MVDGNSNLGGQKGDEEWGTHWTGRVTRVEMRAERGEIGERGAEEDDWGAN